MGIARTRLRYVARRLAQAVPILLGIAVMNFLLLQLAPGDAATVLAGEAGSATPEYMAMLRQRFGLDQPLSLQLLYYVKQVLVLDLGFSFRHNMSVLALILERLAEGTMPCDEPWPETRVQAFRNWIEQGFPP